MRERCRVPRACGCDQEMALFVTGISQKPLQERREGRCEHHRFPESEDVSKQRINVNSNKETLRPTQFCFLLIKGGKWSYHSAGAALGAS